MAARSKDPTPDEIKSLCREFRFSWSDEDRELALAYAPAAAVTDAADAIYTEGLERGEVLSYDQCIQELNDYDDTALPGDLHGT